jgi:allantoinase
VSRPDFDLVLTCRRAVIDDTEKACAIGVRDGQVTEIASVEAGLTGHRHLTLADDEVLIPGLVDTHVHVNEPGRTHWEGFASATRAAAAGGITTIVDMPLNCLPPTVDAAALATKRAAAEGQCHVDVGFWGGAVPGNTAELPALHEQGVFGFKCFLADSGVEEFPRLTVGQMREAMTTIASLGSLLIVHAEDAASLDRAPAAHGRRYRDFLASRPHEA